MRIIYDIYRTHFVYVCPSTGVSDLIGYKRIFAPCCTCLHVFLVFKLHRQIKNKEGYSPQKLYHPYDVSFLWDNRVVVVEGFWPYSRIQLLDLQGRSIMSLAQGIFFLNYYLSHMWEDFIFT